MRTVIPWRIFFILLVLSLLSVLTVFPYVVTLQGDLLRQTGQPLVLILLVQLVQSAIFFSIAIFLGLVLVKKINFYLPLLEAFTAKKEYKDIVNERLLVSVLLGVTTAISIYAVDYVFTLQGAAISTSQNLAPVWQKLLAAVYGGITEEVLLRLFVMSLLVWIGMKLLRQATPSREVVITAIVLAAVIFGLGHLPFTASLTKLTSLIVTRAIVLNGIGGIVFGWLFWKKGLESAMIAHFTTDIVLLTVLPSLFRY